ncbi:MAG: hypothetical protein ACYTGJ_04915 [Planctomycetota bacterium]|jgi:hypothetical protein
MTQPAEAPRRAKNLGGRPRVRSGDEVQVTVEFPLKDYAKLAGLVDFKKAEAARNKESVADQSKRKILLELWREFYAAQPEEVRREVESGDRFQRELGRRTPPPAERAASA